MEQLTCYTAPGMVFVSRNELLEHYKSEWHRYNLKRKVSLLPPITEEMFNRVKKQIEQQRQLFLSKNENKKKDHLKKERTKGKGGKDRNQSHGNQSSVVRKARLNAMRQKAAESKKCSSGSSEEKDPSIMKNSLSTDVEVEIEAEDDVADDDTGPLFSFERSSAADYDDFISNDESEPLENIDVMTEETSEIMAGNSVPSLMASSEAAENDSDADEDLGFIFDVDEAKKEVNVCESLFELDETPLVFDEVSDNLTFMHKRYGFFIPDRDYLVDLHGFLRYCSMKIRVGKLCLYCDKRFKTKNSLVQHMVSKNHCKVRWTPTEGTQAGGVGARPESHELEAGEVDGFDEYVEFYDYTQEVTQGKKLLRTRPVDVKYLDSGELLFEYQDGFQKIIGNRYFKRYYKQKFRVDEASEALIANVKEQRQRFQKLLSLDQPGSAADGTLANGSTFSLSDTRSIGRGDYALCKIYRHLERRLVKKQQKRIATANKMSLRDGIQGNLLMKNRTAKKNVGQGLGVHG